MPQPYNMVNYGVSQLLTNVIKHKGITTTLAKCVTRCKHHFCSLCPFLICIDTHPPCLNPYNMVNYGVSQLLTNVIKHMGITTTLAKCVTRCKHSICSLWHFLLCIFTTHPPPPSSLFYSTEINSLLPETGFRCFLQSTVLPSIKGGNYGLFLVTHSHWEQGQNLFPHTQVMKT